RGASRGRSRARPLSRARLERREPPALGRGLIGLGRARARRGAGIGRRELLEHGDRARGRALGRLDRRERPRSELARARRVGEELAELRLELDLVADLHGAVGREQTLDALLEVLDVRAEEDGLA